MIDYVNGRIISLSPTQIVVETAGIGYIFEISLRSFNSFEGKTDAKVYAQKQVNPRDGLSIDYGFSTQQERELFRMITSVSGMGASTARMILSSFGADEFRDAILGEDINKIKSIKGMGLKTAQRLILELKDKIVQGEGSDSSTVLFANTNPAEEEATRALQMLGFAKPNIQKALQKILKTNPAATVEDIIKAALQML